MNRPIEHLDVLRALRRVPQRLEGLEPAVRATLQAVERDRAHASRRDLLLAEDLRRVRSAVADLLQDVEDRG